MKQPPKTLVVRNLPGSHRQHIVLSRHWTHETARAYIQLARECDSRNGVPYAECHYQLLAACALDGSRPSVGDVVSC